jgi:hypothetical protein
VCRVGNLQTVAVTERLKNAGKKRGQSDKNVQYFIIGNASIQRWLVRTCSNTTT